MTSCHLQEPQSVLGMHGICAPVGLNLLMSSYRFHKPVGEVLRSVLPVVAVLSTGLLLITYIPGLTTVLPKLFGY